ncbi:hypothetical protein SSX86_030437 [Deinandra increscens subsp. villosa]|uniref:Protein kinase domain-containing protein n=1 Tax=Deinandra increscens subsp. villosa TaxID=3103831 RepID=A0AAP0GIA1_9ASTR
MAHPFRHIQYPEIESATNSFDQVIGRGGFGIVYKGTMTYEDGNREDVAIKRMSAESTQGVAEFESEVDTLPNLRHCNIVALRGYCVHENEKILVYEYMSFGTLNDHLHTRRTPLSWANRLNIFITASHGLQYLHNYVADDSALIHGDFKSSNILLNERFEAKISDFGLSKTCRKDQPSTYVIAGIRGTFGTIDPSLFQTGRLRRKSDVYAFGVLMLEVLCRKRVLSDVATYGDDGSVVTWGLDHIKQGKFKEIIDEEIRGEISSKGLKKLSSIIKSCLHRDPDPRPTMTDVVQDLEKLQTGSNRSWWERLRFI